MYHLYILQCSDKTLYTGITVDVVQRVKAHNHSPRAAKYTRSRRPVKLMYAKRFRTRSKALKEEYRIKQLSRRGKLALIVQAMNTNINAVWHRAHMMLKNPTLDQRVKWHVAHAKHCGCRKLEGKIRKEIKRQGLKIG